MPDMNGLEVLGRLKADPRLREIPVIMISGLQDTDSVIRCIEAGAEDYLPKPFDPVLLRARIGASLERKRWHDRERHYLVRLAAEKERSEALLRNILPEPIISRLNDGERVIADRLDEVTIVFCDLVGFTEIAARTSPPQLVNDLNHLFSAFDALTRWLEIEKIKTIGDAYMAAAGLPEARPDHAEAAAELALGMLDAVEQFNSASETSYRVRIGMHTGPVVAGIIGIHKFIYDVWGDTVNVASRLEAHGLPGRIHVSEQTRRALEHRYEFEPCGPVHIRGKGSLRTAFLSARRPHELTLPRPSWWLSWRQCTRHGTFLLETKRAAQGRPNCLRRCCDRPSQLQRQPRSNPSRSVDHNRLWHAHPSGSVLADRYTYSHSENDSPGYSPLRLLIGRDRWAVGR